MVQREPQIAVLLAAYNGRQWIDEQLASILSQSNVSVTVFVSVDCCDDGTYEWVSAFAAREPAVVLLPYGERFGSAGANFFRLLKDVDFSAYDAVAFADQDDIWLPRKLQRAWQFLAAGRCDAFSSDVLAFWPDGREYLVKKSYPQQPFDHFFEAAGPGCTYVLSANVAIMLQDFLRTQTHINLGAMVLHDWFTYAFVREQGLHWYIDDQALMYYRQHSANEVGVNRGWQAYRKRLTQIASKRYRQQVETLLSTLKAPQKVLFARYRGRLRSAWQCRRRPRDKYVLLVMFLFGIY